MALKKHKKEALAKEMEKRQHFDCTLLEREKIENRSRFRYLDRYMQTQRRELEAAEHIEKEKQAVAVKELQCKKDEQLAAQLDQMRREEWKEQCMRQYLRENSHELRELESKLKAAYCNKQLMTQLAEKEALHLEKKNREKQAQEILEAARANEDEYRKRIMEDDLQRKLKYKQELQDQIIFKERRKRYMYEEFLHEKKMIDDIIQRIHDEDERIFEERMCKMKKTKEEMLSFKDAQELWKNREREELEAENQRIQEYLQHKARIEHERKKEQYIEASKKEKISNDLARELYAKETKRREKEYFIQELQQEELFAVSEERHKQEIEKQLRNRLEIRCALKKQLEDNEERLKKLAVEDSAYEAQLMAQAVEQQRLDLLSDQKRRLKKIQLRKDIEQMMNDRRQKRAEEMQRLIRLDEEHKEEAKKRRRIIEEERLKLLKEHAKNLIGYIPSGVLREEDLEHLGSDIHEKYKKRSFVTCGTDSFNVL